MAGMALGCAAVRQYPPPPILAASNLVEVSDREGDVETQSGSRGDSPAIVPENVLVLSGGGAYGAYTAGLLKGWTASGTRPRFDVVTGISTGSLIAPYAFLGPEYDNELERLYTSMRQENILRPQLVLLDSLVSSEPLEQQIAARATPDLLRKIAEAHRHGRRLYVGTTNLDTKQLVIWDAGAIAARETPENATLFRKVLLASCSVPGLLPPVPIDVEIDGQRFTELHVDGSVTACAFLQPAMLGIRPHGELPQRSVPASIYVVVAGKLLQNPGPIKSELFSIAGESINTALQAKTDGELLRLFLLARYAKAKFQIAGIPQDYDTQGTPMLFVPKTMRRLFDEGYGGGHRGSAWQAFPPTLEKEVMNLPRGGVRFARGRDDAPESFWLLDRIRITLDDDSTKSRNGTGTVPSIQRLPATGVLDVSQVTEVHR